MSDIEKPKQSEREKTKHVYYQDGCSFRYGGRHWFNSTLHCANVSSLGHQEGHADLRQLSHCTKHPRELYNKHWTKGEEYYKSINTQKGKKKPQSFKESPDLQDILVRYLS